LTSLTDTVINLNLKTTNQLRFITSTAAVYHQTCLGYSQSHSNV